MKTITVRLRCPDALSVTSLARALEALGVWVEAVPQPGTHCHAKPAIEDVRSLPFRPTRKWPSKACQQ